VGIPIDLTRTLRSRLPVSNVHRTGKHIIPSSFDTRGCGNVVGLTFNLDAGLLTNGTSNDTSSLKTENTQLPNYAILLFDE